MIDQARAPQAQADSIAALAALLAGVTAVTSDRPFDAALEHTTRPAARLVYPKDSAHSSTVSGGEALVLDSLPDAAIESSKS